jgi:NADH-quinone oxidoreductase subunit H
VEADSEIVAGFNIEYSGMKFALLFLMEYSEAIAIAAITTTLFLGGWKGPLLPPFLWFLIKVFAVFLLIIWIRATVPRFRIDQVMAFAWKFLLPLALINLLVTGAQVLFWPEAAGTWPIILINMALAVFLVLMWSRLFKPGGGRVEV